MEFSKMLKNKRKQLGLSQEELAEKINVSRQAVTKWETGKGMPDISNLISLNNEFDMSLDELIKGDEVIKKKIIRDSNSKKWHLLVILYLVVVLGYIAYFFKVYNIFMVGFLISTLFMLFLEVRIFIKERIYKE